MAANEKLSAQEIATLIATGRLYVIKEAGGGGFGSFQMTYENVLKPVQDQIDALRQFRQDTGISSIIGNLPIDTTRTVYPINVKIFKEDSETAGKYNDITSEFIISKSQSTTWFIGIYSASVVTGLILEYEQ